MHQLHHFNHWAILVSGVFLWLLGAVWYSPALFAKPWMALLGIKMGDGNKKSMLAGMVSSFIGDLLLSFILAHFVIAWDADNFGTGAFIGFISWLGFIVAPNFPQGIYENRPIGLFWINSGYWLVGITVVGGILAAWR